MFFNQSQEVGKLYSTHEEADSKMMLLAKLVSPPANIVISSVNTDVLIIALVCSEHKYFDEYRSIC